MNDDSSQSMTDEEQLSAADLEGLKAKADMLKISYHPSIGADKLREKISAHLAEEEEDTPTPSPEPGSETKAQKADRIRKEATALVRCRVTCMNPAKKNIEGEIFTTGNAVTGTIKKYVPFNAELGWHVPRMIFDMLKARKCQIFVEERAPNGMKTKRGKLIPEFSVEELEPLSESELKALAQRQAMASGA